MRRRAISVVATIGLFFGSILSACTDSPTHVFFGQEYDATRDCLESVTAVDTISGHDTGQSCSLVCVAAPPDPEAGVAVFVSTTCPPYPPLFDASGTSAECQLALAAANRKATCLSDGGVSTATPPEDSGASDADVGDAPSDQ